MVELTGPDIATNPHERPTSTIFEWGLTLAKEPLTRVNPKQKTVDLGLQRGLVGGHLVANALEGHGDGGVDRAQDQGLHALHVPPEHLVAVDGVEHVPASGFRVSGFGLGV